MADCGAERLGLAAIRAVNSVFREKFLRAFETVQGSSLIERVYACAENILVRRGAALLLSIVLR